MELTFNRMERIVGIFVIGIAVLLLSTMVFIGRGKDWFEKSIVYYTTFNEGYNLQVATPVKLFKTDIGRVKQITLVENKVRVKLSILQKYESRIRVDAVAAVESPTFIGSEYVSIVPGSPSADPIPPEGEIPSKERKSIADILAEFQVERTARMIVQAIQNIAEITAALNDPQGALYATLNNISTTTGHIKGITGDVRQGSGSLGSLVSTRELMDEVMARLNQVEVILGNVDTAAAKTPLAMDRVNTSLTSLNGTSENIDHIVVGIKDATENLKEILENVKTGSHDVPVITNTTKEGIAEIREGVADIDKVVQSLQKNILIRGNLPSDPKMHDTSTGLRK